MHAKKHKVTGLPRTIMKNIISFLLVASAILGTSLPPARVAANAVFNDALGEIPAVSAAASDEWMQEGHDAQRTGYTSEEPQTPWTLAWTFNGPDANGGTGGHMYNAPADAHTVTGGANLYAPAGSMGLFALNKTSGAQAWRLTSPSFNATPAYDPASGYLFAGGADGKLYKINASTGQVASTYTAGSPINKAVMLVGASAYAVTDSGELHKVNTGNMSRAWVYAAGSAGSTAPAYSSKAGVIVYATRDLYVHAVKDSDGAAQWRVKPTNHPAQDPYTFAGFWPVIAEQHGIVFVRLNLGSQALWSGTGSGGMYPGSNAETRALLQANNGALENLFALDLASGSKKFIPAVGYGGVEKRIDASGSGLFLEAPPVPVVKINSDGSEVAYIAFRTSQGNPPDGRWDSYMGEMVLDNTTISGLAAGDLRFMNFPNSFVKITDEQTPFTMAGNTLFHAHWGASESARILDRSVGKGLTASNPITMQGLPPVIRRMASCSNFDPKTHYTTCGLTLINDGRYWSGPGYWTYWNVNDPPTPVSNAYSDGHLPRYTYVSAGMMVVEGNGGDLMVFRHSGSSVSPTPPAPQPTSVQPTATKPAPTATKPAPTQPAPTQPAATQPQPTQPAPTQAPAPAGSLSLNTYDEFNANMSALDKTLISDALQGSLSLAGQLADDFTQSSLNTSAWSASTTSGGAYSPSLGSSQVTIPGGRIIRSNATFTRGSFDAVAQFENSAGQIVGFARQAGGARYFAFSTQSGDGSLYALVNHNGSDQLTNLGPIPTGMHRYRVEWTQAGSSDAVNFFIDGRSVAQVSIPGGTTNLNVYMVNNGGGTLRLDKAQVTPPYVSSGTFTSKTLDAGSGSTWQNVSWNASIPSGTSMSLAVRTSADGSRWSSWANITTSGGAVKSPNRYMQLWVSLSTTNSSISPVVDAVTVSKSGGSGPAPTATKPAPTATKPAPTTTRIAPTATKPAPTATKPAPTATKPGPTATKPAPTATKPVPTQPQPTQPAPTQLQPTQPAPTQPQPTVPPVAPQTVTFNSFDELKTNCGGEDHVQVTDLNSGSIVLAPSLLEEFNQPALDGNLWTAGSLSGASYTPAFQNGAIVLPANGFVRSTAGFTHGTLEVVAQIEPNSGQVIAFGGDQSTGVRYFMFNTQVNDGNLYALVSNNSGEQVSNLGKVPTGMHRYRIEWKAADAANDSVAFFIDGQEKARMTVTNAGATGWNVYLVNSGTGTLTVDKAQVAPAYTPSGVYTSSAQDAGAGAAWQTLAWNAALQSGNAVAFAARTSPDGSNWRNWTAVEASGNAISNPDRFVQFSVQLSTSDENTTPIIDSVTLSKLGAQPTSPPVQPTATQPPTQPTATNVPPVQPTATSVPPVQPTATSVAPTATKPAPTATPQVTPTKTPVTPTTPPPSSAKVSNLQVVSGSPAVYEKFEVQFDVQTSATALDMPYDANPPAGVKPGIGITVNGLFSNDGWKTTITQPGFVFQPYNITQNGGDPHFVPTGKPVWAVRFAPQKSGSWQYRLSITDAQGTVLYPASNQSALSFSVGASSSNPYVRRGFLGVSATDSRYFQFQDGTPFVGVGFNDGYDNSAQAEQKMTAYEQNKMNFMRVWLSGSGINGSQWTAWASHHLPNDAYLPGVNFDVANTYNGGTVSMRLDDSNPCFYADFWRGGVPVQPNTSYTVTARVKVSNVTGPAASGDYGFVIKQGGWLDKACSTSGTGKRITAPVSGSSDWTTVTGTYTTGSGENWLGGLYLTRENARGGQVYIDEVHMYRTNDTAKAELLRQPYANVVEHFDMMSSALWDMYLQSAEKHGVYLKLVMDEKNEWIRNRIGADGNLAAPSNDNFYAAEGTKVRWLHEAWWRYIIARWGYSTAVHSFEFINEGDPYNGKHYDVAGAMANYFDANDPSRHMVTTSFWHSFPNAEFWSNPKYAGIDYADVHAYLSTGWGPDASFLPSQLQETNTANVHSGKVSARIPGNTQLNTNIVPRGAVIQGQGEWVIKYWMKSSGLTANCPYSTTGSMARVRWSLDGGAYSGGKEGVIPANAEAKDFVCTSPAGTFDWRQFSSTSDRDGKALPNTARIIVTDNNPHALSVSIENSSGTGGTVWIDDVQIISPEGKVQPVIGTFETTRFEDDTAWSTNAYSQIFGGGGVLGARKPLVRAETGLDINNAATYNPDMLRDTRGVWLHKNVWGQINSGGMMDLFWWSTETIKPEIWNNFLTYRNFMEGIPLNNGRYKDIGATTSHADLRVYGQRDDTAGRMHLWVQNAQHTWKSVVSGQSVAAINGTVTIPNVATGSYRVEWWNTYNTSNPVIKTETINSNGSLTLTLPSGLSDDIAVKITKN